MTMEPVPETVEALNELEPEVDAEDLLTHLTRLANRAKEVVPDLVGVSLAGLHGGLTFTLVATASEIAVLDAVRYAAGGPWLEGDDERHGRRDDSGPGSGHEGNEGHEGHDGQDVLDEERWRLYAEATAARAVRSTLTLPVLAQERVVGAVNLYAASRRAFAGHSEELAAVFGAWAAGAVTNADLPFRTRVDARQAPEKIREQAVIDVAVGILAAQLGIDVQAAEERLRDAAARARVSTADLARDIVRARQWRDADPD